MESSESGNAKSRVTQIARGNGEMWVRVPLLPHKKAGEGHRLSWGAGVRVGEVDNEASPF